MSLGDTCYACLSSNYLAQSQASEMEQISDERCWFGARWMVLGAVLSLTACTQYWAKPGGTTAEFDATKSTCGVQAYSQFPPMMQQVMLTAGYTTPMQTSCSGTGYAVNCFTTGGQYMPPVYMSVDQNEAGRNSAVRACLFAAGWQPVKDKAEALAVTNSAPARAAASPGVSPSVDPVRVEQAKRRAVKYCDAVFYPPPGNPGMVAVFGNNHEVCVTTRTRDYTGIR